MPEHILNDKDTSLYYRVEGEGRNVFLLHGFGEDSTIWDTLVPSLKSGYRLIIPDIPGSGRSTGNLEGASMESLADEMLKILDKEQVSECVMIGHSMGGYITLAFAEKYADRLNAFGLFHSTTYADDAQKIEIRKKNIDFIRKHGSEKFLQQAIPNLFSEEFRKNNPDIIRDLVNRYSNFSATALVCYTEAMMNRPERTDVLRNFRKPVLFIMGEYDTAVPLQHGLEQCNIPEFSYIYIAAHSGHMGMLEEPEFCLKALSDFLSAK